MFVLCCVKWQSCATGHRCPANVNVSLDFAWQQLCPQPLQFPVPTSAARNMAKLCGGRGHTCWHFLSRLSIYADSLGSGLKGPVFILCEVWWWLTQSEVVRSRAIICMPSSLLSPFWFDWLGFFSFYLSFFHSMGFWRVQVPQVCQNLATYRQITVPL